MRKEPYTVIFVPAFIVSYVMYQAMKSYMQRLCILRNFSFTLWIMNKCSFLWIYLFIVKKQVCPHPFATQPSTLPFLPYWGKSHHRWFAVGIGSPLSHRSGQRSEQGRPFERFCQRARVSQFGRTDPPTHQRSTCPTLSIDSAPNTGSYPLEWNNSTPCNCDRFSTCATSGPDHSPNSGRSEWTSGQRDRYQCRQCSVWCSPIRLWICSSRRTQSKCGEFGYDGNSIRWRYVCPGH